MRTVLKQTRNQGFTLVEILVVVILLGILAAIVIPQFMNSSEDARLSALKSDFQTVRGQIQLFKLKSATSAYSVLTGVDATDPLVTGGYLPKFPVNQFNSLATVGVAADEATVGWVYDSTTGVIYAGGGGSTNGVAHNTW